MEEENLCETDEEIEARLALGTVVIPLILTGMGAQCGAIAYAGEKMERQRELQRKNATLDYRLHELEFAAKEKNEQIYYSAIREDLTNQNMPHPAPYLLGGTGIGLTLSLLLVGLVNRAYWKGKRERLKGGKK